MQITVVEPCYGPDMSKNFVKFRSKIGEGAAMWTDMDIVPLIGKSYSVEFSILPVIHLGGNAELSEVMRMSVQVDGLTCSLIGVIEQVDDDGMLFVRLATDCLIMAESAQGVFQVGQTIAIHIHCSELQISPIGISV